MLLACWPAVVLAAPVPAWLTSFPHHPDAYVGIGHSDKRQYPARYREVAQAAALSQISKEISVSLRSEETLFRREDGAGWEEEWRQSLRAESRSELTGYRLVDVFETGSGFWVFYALDKAEHARQRESRLSGQAATLESLLSSRALAEACRRLAPPGPAAGPASEGRDRLAAIGERIRTAAGRAELAPGPGPWAWHPGNGSAEASVRLRDGADGKDWKGPLRLRVMDQAVPGGICMVETDAEGRFALAPIFLDCGLGPGRWKVTWMITWMGEESEGPSAWVEARLPRHEWVLTVRAEAGGLIPWEGPVAAELTALPSPYFRIRREADAGAGEMPRLEVALTAAEADSLDGLHFATLRGTLRLPGGFAFPVTGKGGGSDPAKARDRASRDFAVQAGKRLLLPGYTGKTGSSGKKARAFPG